MDHRLLKELAAAWHGAYNGMGEDEIAPVREHIESMGIDWDSALSGMEGLVAMADGIGMKDTLARLAAGEEMEGSEIAVLSSLADSVFPGMVPASGETGKDRGSAGIGFGISAEPDGDAREEEQMSEEPHKEAPMARDGLLSGLEELSYMIAEDIASGRLTEARERAYGRKAERIGGSYNALRTLAEEIMAEGIANGLDESLWRAGDSAARSYFRGVFIDERPDDALMDGFDEEGMEEFSEAMSDLESLGRETYMLTNSDVERIASTSTGRIREVVSPEMFDERGEPDPDGIFSERLFGPLHGSACQCGECRFPDTESARLGAVCPECGEELMSSSTRNEAYALVRSPVPLLWGREPIAAVMLDTSEDAIRSMMSGERRFCLQRTVSPSGTIESSIAPANEAKGEKIFGPKGVREALKALSHRTAEGTAGGMGLAAYRALRNLEAKRKQYVELRSQPASGGQRENEEEWRKAVSFAEDRFVQATAIYRSVVSLTVSRKGEPEDIMLDSMLVTPPGTRPVNDRNGISDYGEENKALVALIRQISILKELERSGRVSEELESEMEKAIYDATEGWLQVVGARLNGKTGIMRGRIMVTRSDELLRAVISPTSHEKGRQWFSSIGLDIEKKDMIGLPRSGARKMYEKEIRKVLKQQGLSPEEIAIELGKAPGTMERQEDGTMSRCVADRALDTVMENGGQGQIVMYTRQPTISPGSQQAGYAYLVDDDAMHVYPLVMEALSGDFDGDTMTAVKLLSKGARENGKRLMRRNIIADGTGQLLIKPKLEGILGLYGLSAFPEDYAFSTDVVVSSMEDLRERGIVDSEGKATRSCVLKVRHILEDLDGATIDRKAGSHIPAGERYGTREDGTPLVAEWATVIESVGDKTFALLDFEDAVLVPRGAAITGKKVLGKGEPIASVRPFKGSERLIQAAFDKGVITYNQPCLLAEDGIERKTTAGRLAVERLLPYGRKLLDDERMDKSLFEQIIQESLPRMREELGEDGARDAATRTISALAELGFDANFRFGVGMSYKDFLSIAPIDTREIYERHPGIDKEAREQRAAMYEERKRELGARLKEMLGNLKTSYAASIIGSGIKSLSILLGLSAPDMFSNYNGVPHEIGTGRSLVMGAVGIEAANNSAKSGKSNNKTEGVDKIGWYRNIMAAAMNGATLEEGDCGTELYEERSLTEDNAEALSRKLEGRMLARDLARGDGTTILEKGKEITREAVLEAARNGVRSIAHRSALGCRCKGSCRACAGHPKGDQSKEGENISLAALAAFIAPFSQDVMDISKNGGKTLGGADLVEAFINGYDIPDGVSTDPMALAQAVKQDAIAKTGGKLPELYAEAIAKTFIKGTGGRNPIPRSMWEGGITEAFFVSGPARFQGTLSHFEYGGSKSQRLAGRDLMSILSRNDPHRTKAPPARKRGADRAETTETRREANGR